MDDPDNFDLVRVVGRGILEKQMSVKWCPAMMNMPLRRPYPCLKVQAKPSIDSRAGEICCQYVDAVAYSSSKYG